MRNKTFRLAIALLLAAGLAGCADAGPRADSVEIPYPAPPDAVPAAAADDAAVRFELDRTLLPLKQWRHNGSHLAEVKGRLLLHGKPVAGAVLHAGTNPYDIKTGEDGSYRLHVDQSLLAKLPVHVVSLEGATIEGRKLRGKEAKRLKKASADLQVYFPIRVDRVESVPGHTDQVEVHARLINRKEDVISFFQVDKYCIKGTVKDADGKPVQGAVVWIHRGEGFGRSTPSDAKGAYRMYYFPEPAEDTELSVVVGAKTYTLPEHRVFHMPDRTSVNIDIALPRQGTVIADKPPTLLASKAPGAMYMGVLPGLHVPSGVDYTVTIPDDKGNFTIRIAKQAWERNPTFFEMKLSQYVEDRQLKAGDVLASGFLHPGAKDPQRIVAEATQA